MEHLLNCLKGLGTVLILSMIMVVVMKIAIRFGFGVLPTEEEAREKILAEYPKCRPEDLITRKEIEPFSWSTTGGEWAGAGTYNSTRTYLEYPPAGVSIQIQSEDME